jgi:hypothetical protein
MDHREAVQEMATERYLLDELTPELRDAFEEHMFDCPECAVDLRAGAVFLDEAKTQLPGITASAKAPEPVKPVTKRPRWFFWPAPAFAMPAFAALLAVIAYQNFSTIPALRMAASEPRLLPWTSLHAGTRGAESTQVTADRKWGTMILVDIPQQPAYASYEFNLYDPQGKRFWTRTVSGSEQNDGGGGPFSLEIPGPGLQQGSYTLDLSGISPQGARTEIGRRVLDVHLVE